MFLTKLNIDDAGLVHDFYKLHGLIYSLFPETAKFTDRRDPQTGAILYRLENGESPYVIIQSRMAPMWGDTKKFTPMFETGSSFWYRLRASVTKRRTTDGRRIGIIDMDEQINWLHRKATMGGFGIVTATIIDRPGTIRSERDGTEVVAITPVTFEGILTVRDPAQMLITHELGIGTAKGFGCGLLTLAMA